MDLSWLESLLYGLVSGLAEFLPVSAQAHRTILLKLFGVSGEDALFSFFLHAGALAAVLAASQKHIRQIKRERKLVSDPKRRRKYRPDMKTLLDQQIVKSAFFPALLGFVLYFGILRWRSNLLVIAAFLILNGFLLFLPSHLPAGNKDSRSMSRFDALLFGLAGALGMLPGISRVGATTSVAIARGADKQQALSWSLLFSIPILICLMALDAYGFLSQGAGGLQALVLFQYLFGAAAAFCGAYIAITFMRFLAVNLGFSCFAYYSWGAALFTFILFLTI